MTDFNIKLDNGHKTILSENGDIENHETMKKFLNKINSKFKTNYKLYW